MENKNSDVFSYGQIAQEVKNHLKSRSALIFKRSILLSWPALILIGVFSFVGNVRSIMEFFVAYPLLMVLILILIVAAVIYTFAFAHILGMEKYVWIDSHFDKIDLSPDESFSIAKRIFWKSFKLKMYLFFRYYFLPLALYFLVFFLGIYLPSEFDMTYNPYWFILMIVVVCPILVYIFYYYLKIKLRYFWFIFFDNFGNANFSADKIIEEIKRLNNINKSESFKKSIVSSLGIDFSKDMALHSSGFVLSGIFGKAGQVGKALENVGGAYASETASQFASYAKIVANRILYEVAIKELYCVDRIVNKELYSIVGK